MAARSRTPADMPLTTRCTEGASTRRTDSIRVRAHARVGQGPAKVRWNLGGACGLGTLECSAMVQLRAARCNPPRVLRAPRTMSLVCTGTSATYLFDVDCGGPGNSLSGREA